MTILNPKMVDDMLAAIETQQADNVALPREALTELLTVWKAAEAAVVASLDDDEDAPDYIDVYADLTELFAPFESDDPNLASVERA